MWIRGVLIFAGSAIYEALPTLKKEATVMVASLARASTVLSSDGTVLQFVRAG